MIGWCLKRIQPQFTNKINKKIIIAYIFEHGKRLYIKKVVNHINTLLKLLIKCLIIPTSKY